MAGVVGGRSRLMMSRLLVALGLASMALSPPLALQAQNPSRGLTVVPAPVGPDGGVQELYAGSYALLVGVSRYDTPSAWAPSPLVSLARLGLAPSGPYLVC
jgi:hypothetical protein